MIRSTFSPDHLCNLVSRPGPAAHFFGPVRNVSGIFTRWISVTIFMSPSNVVWPEAYCFCPVPVRLCVRPETLLTRYLAEYLTHSHQ